MTEGIATKEQTQADYSVEAFEAFLEVIRDRMITRPPAVQRILAQIPEGLGGDLRRVNMDEIAETFREKQQGRLKELTLNVYVSSLRSAVRDFFTWVEDPEAFEYRLRGAADHKDPWADESKQVVHIRIPLRVGVVVDITGVPRDLTTAEFSRIRRFISALVAE